MPNLRGVNIIYLVKEMFIPKPEDQIMVVDSYRDMHRI
jgi:hypothetical protein